MKEGREDIVIDKLHQRADKVRARFIRQYKGTKPFRMEPVSDEELLYDYNQLTPEKINEFINLYGRETVNEMIMKMEQIKARRAK